MPCRTLSIPGGGFAIVCSRGSNPRRTCVVCHRGERSTDMKLCDFPLHGAKKGQTCDRSLCAAHAYHIEPDTDYCPAHARLMQSEQLPLVEVRHGD